MLALGKTLTDSNVYSPVVLVPFVQDMPQPTPQKKRSGLNPLMSMTIKSVNCVFCVDSLSCAHVVTNDNLVVPNTPVGARLQLYWRPAQKWS